MNEIFNKYYNLIFLLVVSFNNLIPKKIRSIFYLIISLLFFYIMSGKLIIYLLITITSIYISALLINKVEEKQNSSKKIKSLILIVCILINLAFLIVFKYLKFFTISTNSILSILGINFSFNILKFVAPIGISFYTLQGLSYLFDVYNKKIKAEKNFIKVALFISFFPQIMEGPIARYEETSNELYKNKNYTYDSFCFGMQRVIWGIFKKMVIADRLNIVVKTVFRDYQIFSGPFIFIGAMCFTIMLYMEFSGAMDVVIGTGEIIGVKIPENFRQPFFSRNISEFWTRWHISLGKWFKNYIYFPVSLSKPVKKINSKVKKMFGRKVSTLVSSGIALFVVWLLNGLWHGAGLTFILFGLYHFILIFLGNILKPYIDKRTSKFSNNKLFKVLQNFKVAILVIIGELIFWSPNVKALFIMLSKLFTNFTIDKASFVKLGLDIPDCIILVLSLSVVFIVSLLKEKNINVREEIAKKNIIIRWSLYYILIFSIILFGAYGPGYQPVEPIYADF